MGIVSWNTLIWASIGWNTHWTAAAHHPKWQIWKGNIIQGGCPLSFAFHGWHLLALRRATPSIFLGGNPWGRAVALGNLMCNCLSLMDFSTTRELTLWTLNCGVRHIKLDWMEGSVCRWKDIMFILVTSSECCCVGCTTESLDFVAVTNCWINFAA